PDLVDLEYFLSQDARAEATVLTRRDRDFYRSRLADTPPGSRRDLLYQWLEQRRQAARGETTAPLPGDVVGPLLRAFPPLLFLLGALAGGILVWGVLSYSGDQPINLFAALGLLVALPFFFTLLSALLPLWRRALGGAPAGLVGGWLTGVLLTRLSRRAYALLAQQKDGENRLALAGEWGSLRGRGRLYSGLLGWLAFGWMQLAALGFSLAVLLTVVLRGWIADLAFSWQTTTRISAEQVHSFVAALARPWTTLVDLPLAHPTLEQVAGSRVFLKEGLQHLASADLQSWWYFLVWAILVYTVLPRLLLLGVARVGGRRARRRLSFADARCEALIRRMQQPRLEIGKDGEVADDEHPPELSLPREMSAGMGRLHALVPEELLAGAAADRWRGEIERQFNASVAALDPVKLDEGEDADLLQRLAGESSQASVLLVLEGWQPCITATLEYLKALRRLLGKERLLVVALVGRDAGERGGTPTPEHEFGIWRQRLAALGDPWLLVHNWGRSADE
ncbi:MAG: DUF2868 domain-containing protein, partial [Desulfuromonadales bacterium]|nr:DUF2868 domain-containing protein [Desulfuromonadales bacterium]